MMSVNTKHTTSHSDTSPTEKAMDTKIMPATAVIAQLMRSVQRMAFGGGLHLISLGVLPGVLPQHASQLALAHVALVNDGPNSADLRKAAKRRPGDNQLQWTLRKYEVLHPASFLSVANDWLEALELPWSGKYRDAVQGRIRNHVLPAIGHKTMGFSTLNDITGHGFGAVGRTLTEQALKWDSALAELQLDHTVKDANGRAYNRTHMLEQRREMMQEWADYLDGLRLGEIIYDDPLHGFTPITQKVEIPSPPAAQIEVTPVRPIDFENFRNRISTRQKNGRHVSVHQFSMTKPVSSGVGMPPEVERQPALKGGSHAPNDSWR